jgi:hypothetical protein
VKSTGLRKEVLMSVGILYRADIPHALCHGSCTESQAAEENLEMNSNM